MIDASGSGATLSVVGNTSQDGATYETVDFFVRDVRASGISKGKPFHFDGKAFKFSGDVDQSDDTSTKGQIDVQATCD